ncbi:MAG: hypothetical protein WC813_04345 [Patescibacteria group bacterium]|jgi:hypothetical protein
MKSVERFLKSGFVGAQIDLLSPRFPKSDALLATITEVRRSVGHGGLTELVLGPAGRKGGNDYWSRCTYPPVLVHPRISRNQDDSLLVHGLRRNFTVYQPDHAKHVANFETLLAKPSTLKEVLEDPQGGVIVTLRHREAGDRHQVYVQSCSGIFMPTAVGVVDEWDWNEETEPPFRVLRVQVDPVGRGEIKVECLMELDDNENILRRFEPCEVMGDETSFVNALKESLQAGTSV